MGLIFSQKQLPCWGVWKIEETIEELLAYFSDTTPFFSFLNSKAPENRKKEWLACRILLNQLLGREVLISYHSTGAPYPEDLSCYISFSHTKGYVAVIWHPDYPVGIDIEYKGERIIKVRERFLSVEENQAIDSENLIEHLLLHWCAKESLFKIIGEVDVDFRKCLHILPFPYDTSGSFAAYETRTPQNKAYKMYYQVKEDFVLTYCVAED